MIRTILLTSLYVGLSAHIQEVPPTSPTSKSATKTMTLKLGREKKHELKITLHGDLVFKPSEDMPLSFRDQGELRVSDKTEGLMRELIIKDQDVTYLENGKPTAISKAKAWVIEIGQDLTTNADPQSKSTMSSPDKRIDDPQAPRKVIMIERKKTDGTEEPHSFEIKMDREGGASPIVMLKKTTGPKGQVVMETQEPIMMLNGLVTPNFQSLENEIKQLREELKQLREELKKLNR
jgi:hypothetical protein